MNMSRMTKNIRVARALIVAILTFLCTAPGSSIAGVEVAIVELLPDLRIVGTVEVQDFDVTYWATPSEQHPLHIQQHGTHERAATAAEVLVTKDGSWKAFGKIAIVAPQDLGGLNTAKGGNTMVLLWNTGHKVTVTMESGATTTIRGKRVRAERRMSFLLTEKDDSQFETRIKDGSLTVLGAGRALTADDTASEPERPDAAQSVKPEVEWIETAEVRKCEVECLNGPSLAVFVRFTPSQQDAVLIFNRENTFAVLSDGRQISEWLVWFSSVQRGGDQIRINEGSLNDIQIILADAAHNKTHGRPHGNGSYLEIGGEMKLGLFHRMVYHNGETGKLTLRFTGPDDVRTLLFLFPSAEAKAPIVEKLRLGGLEAEMPARTLPAQPAQAQPVRVPSLQRDAPLSTSGVRDPLPAYSGESRFKS
jgi:hypothetical protein